MIFSRAMTPTAVHNANAALEALIAEIEGED
jgi:hypothetical protein